jgi:restriction endonuclease S subunit
MTNLAYQYIKLVPFNTLLNWSVQETCISNLKYNQKFRTAKIKDFLKRNKTPVIIDGNIKYKRIKIRLYGKGVETRDIVIGSKIKTKRQFLAKEGQFILSRIDARNGAFGIVSKSCDNSIITNDFWTFDIDLKKINPLYFSLLTSTKDFYKLCQNVSSGTTNRQRISEGYFLNIEIPLPSLKEQQKIVARYNEKFVLANKQENQIKDLNVEAEKHLITELGLEIEEEAKMDAKYKYLNFVEFKELKFWGLDKIIGNNKFKSSKYDLVSINSNPKIIKNVFRGKSPKYDLSSTVFILNQKCVRWNNIELKYAKKVNLAWLNKIDKYKFTKEGDILINSTGEGTIGRATCITNQFKNLLYDSHILLLRVNQKIINPIYLTLLINSKFGQEQINQIKSAQSTKQTELGINNLKKIKFPIPNIEIQNQIVTQNLLLNSKVIELKHQAEENHKKALAEFEKELFE